ncbi:MAG: hypothetical protein AAF512_01005, partial [Pseudomonadota bacterium]
HVSTGVPADGLKLKKYQTVAYSSFQLCNPVSIKSGRYQMNHKPKLSITLLVASERDTRFTIGLSNTDVLTHDKRQAIIDELTRHFILASFDVTRTAGTDLSMLIDTNAPNTQGSLLTYEEIMQQVDIKQRPDKK